MTALRPGFVTGLQSELALIQKSQQDTGIDIPAACQGPGPDRARKAALELVDQGVGGLISFGFAGGIDREAKAGDIVVADEIRKGRIDAISCEPIWSDAVTALLTPQTTVHRRPIAATDEIVKTASEKLRLRYATDAVACDMESFATAEVAHAAGIPFITLRAIIDTSEQDLPPMAVEASAPDGSLKIWRILWSLIRQPAQLKALGPLTRNSTVSTRSLVNACRKLGPEFGLPDYRAVIIRQLREVCAFHS